MDKAEKDRLWAELDALGEDQVRENLGLSRYGRKKDGVKEWLRQEEHKRTSRDDTPWHKTWWWILLSTVVAGVVIAGVVYKLGWT